MTPIMGQARRTHQMKDVLSDTIYIKGKPGFKKAVLRRIDDSWPYGNPDAEHELLMFWLKRKATLRDFKLAIGSKIIFKYRLRFFTSVDEFVKSEVARENERQFSSDEKKMVHDMVTWENSRTRGKANYSK